MLPTIFALAFALASVWLVCRILGAPEQPKPKPPTPTLQELVAAFVSKSNITEDEFRYIELCVKSGLKPKDSSDMGQVLFLCRLLDEYRADRQRQESATNVVDQLRTSIRERQ